jgi:hypothetical protein
MPLSMQAFYTRLFSTQDVPDPLQTLLAQLTRLNRNQIPALKSDLEWVPW